MSEVTDVVIDQAIQNERSELYGITAEAIERLAAAIGRRDHQGVERWSDVLEKALERDKTLNRLLDTYFETQGFAQCKGADRQAIFDLVADLIARGTHIVTPMGELVEWCGVSDPRAVEHREAARSTVKAAACQDSGGRDAIIH